MGYVQRLLSSYTLYEVAARGCASMLFRLPVLTLAIRCDQACKSPSWRALGNINTMWIIRGGEDAAVTLNIFTNWEKAALGMK